MEECWRGVGRAAEVEEAVVAEGTVVVALDPPDVVLDGEFEVVEEAVVVALDPPDVVVDGDLEEVVVVVDVDCVNPINAAGVKAQELAEGEAELRDKYVSLSAEELMLLKSTDSTSLQQMLIWLAVSVQTSLFIHH